MIESNGTEVEKGAQEKNRKKEGKEQNERRRALRYVMKLALTECCKMSEMGLSNTNGGTCI